MAFDIPHDAAQPVGLHDLAGRGAPLRGDGYRLRCARAGWAWSPARTPWCWNRTTTRTCCAPAPIPTRSSSAYSAAAAISPTTTPGRAAVELVRGGARQIVLGPPQQGKQLPRAGGEELRRGAGGRGRAPGRGRLPLRGRAGRPHRHVFRADALLTSAPRACVSRETGRMARAPGQGRGVPRDLFHVKQGRTGRPRHKLYIWKEVAQTGAFLAPRRERRTA